MIKGIAANLRYILTELHRSEACAFLERVPANACHRVWNVDHSQRLFTERTISNLCDSFSVNHLWDVQNGRVTGITSNRNCAVAVIRRLPNNNRFRTAIAAVFGTAYVGVATGVVAGIAGRCIFGRPISSRSCSAILTACAGRHFHAVFSVCVQSDRTVFLIVKVE